MMDELLLRRQAAWLGIGSLAFGAVPAAAPRLFGRLFAIPADDHPTVAAIIRSVGVRDAVIGLGLWSAATHGGNYRPWLLARMLCDTGDTLRIFLGFLAGARNPRFIALGALALTATLLGSSLYRNTPAVERPVARGSGPQP